MRKLIAGMLLAPLCHYAGASVPGDFVDTNLPSGISDRDNLLKGGKKIIVR